MTLRPYLQVLGVTVLLAIGQWLFRKSALSVPSLATLPGLIKLAVTPAFLAALVIYGIATLMWVSVLQQMPLSRAYPFMALNFVAVPLIAILVAGESPSWQSIAGTVLVIAGLLLIGTRA